MSNKQQVRRALALLVILFIGFICLGARLVDLQVIKHEALLAEAERKTERKIWQPAKRGDILDANNNPLATSIPVKTVWVNPQMLAVQTNLPSAPQFFARALAPLLQMDEAKILQQMLPRIHQTTNGVATNQYAVLKRQVNEPAWQQIQATLKTLPAYVDSRGWKKSRLQDLTNLCVTAIGADSEQMRVYPNGSLAGQVIGFTAARQHESRTRPDWLRRNRKNIRRQTCRRGWLACDRNRSRRARARLRTRRGCAGARRLERRAHD
jgi:cell division protein FtsI (penicillin-binding protein 3)